MRAIKELEEGLELSTTIRDELHLQSGKVKQVYLVAPPGNQGLEVPCLMNWPDAGSEQRMGNDREDFWTVQVDFYAPRDGAKGPEIALAFFDLVWDAFDAERKAAERLSQTVDYLVLRSERPMLETLEWNSLGYPGFHIFLDIVRHEDVTP